MIADSEQRTLKFHRCDNVVRINPQDTGLPIKVIDYVRMSCNDAVHLLDNAYVSRSEMQIFISLIEKNWQRQHRMALSARSYVPVHRSPAPLQKLMKCTFQSKSNDADDWHHCGLINTTTQYDSDY